MNIELSRNIVFLIDKAFKEKAATITNKENLGNSSKQTEYLLEFFNQYKLIVESIKRLKNIETYLTINKIPKYFLKNNIDETEYYIHHIKWFHIECVSIIDYVALLVNHTLKLGIPDRKCNVFAITENKNIKGKNIRKELINYEKKLSDIKKFRNEIIHKGKIKPKVYKDLSALSVTDDLKRVLSPETVKFIKEERKIFLKKVLDEFHGYIKITTEHIGNILLALEPYIIEHTEYLEWRVKNQKLS